MRRAKTRHVLNVHAKHRAYQRYGVLLNKESLRELVRQIQTGAARFILRQSCNRTLWEIDLNGRPARVIYDSRRGTICTFLPECSENRTGP
jgi:hypothetical protein